MTYKMKLFTFVMLFFINDLKASGDLSDIPDGRIAVRLCHLDSSAVMTGGNSEDKSMITLQPSRHLTVFLSKEGEGYKIEYEDYRLFYDYTGGKTLLKSDKSLQFPYIRTQFGDRARIGSMDGTWKVFSILEDPAHSPAGPLFTIEGGGNFLLGSGRNAFFITREKAQTRPGAKMWQIRDAGSGYPLTLAGVIDRLGRRAGEPRAFPVAPSAASASAPREGDSVGKIEESPVCGGRDVAAVGQASPPPMAPPVHPAVVAAVPYHHPAPAGGFAPPPGGYHGGVYYAAAPGAYHGGGYVPYPEMQRGYPLPHPAAYPAVAAPFPPVGYPPAAAPVLDPVAAPGSQPRPQHPDGAGEGLDGRSASSQRRDHDSVDRSPPPPR